MPNIPSIFSRIKKAIFGSSSEDNEFKFLKLCKDCEFRKSLEKLLKAKLKVEEPSEESSTVASTCPWSSQCPGVATCGNDMKKCVSLIDSPTPITPRGA